MPFLRRFLALLAISALALSAAAQTPTRNVSANPGTGALIWPTASTFRSANGLAIGSDIQAYNANLAQLAALSLIADRLPYANGTGTLSLTTLTSFARTLLDDAADTDARTTLGLVIGTNVQAYHVNLAQLASLSLIADRLPYANGTGTLSLATFTAFGRQLIDDADASTARSTLGLGTIATQASSNASITGGSITGITDLAIADGGTGQSTAPLAFAALKQDATTSATGVVELATSAETLAGSSTTLAVTPGTWSYASSAIRNALAPRGGVAFDGTTSGRGLVTLTGQNVGSDPFSVVLTLRVPLATSSAEQDLFNLTPLSSGIGVPEVLVSIPSSSADLRINFRSVSGDKRATVSSFVTNYAGKVIQLCVTRSGTTLTVYINSVSTAFTSSTTGATPPDYDLSITSGFFIVGGNTGRTPLSSQVYSASLYNLALSAADVQEIYELGGGVPERFKFGSLAAKNTSSGTVTGGSVSSFASTATTFSGTPGASGAVVQFAGFTIAAARTYRAKFTATTIPDQGIPRFGFGNGPAAYSVTAGSNDITISTTTTHAGSGIYFFTGSGTATVAWDVSALSVTQLGAIFHLPLNDGIGYRLRDTSTNKLDATMTMTGVSHVLAEPRGLIRGTLTWAGTHEGKSVLGQQALPSNAVVTYITTTATVASSGSGLTIGTTGSATRWVAANTYTTAKKLHTLANQLPAGTTANDLDIVLDPDTSNYTGSISIEVHYVITE